MKSIQVEDRTYSWFTDFSRLTHNGSKKIKALSKFCTPVTAELFGHGRSPSPVDVDFYHPNQYVSEFEKIRQDLNTTSWFVCGYSLGAALTARYSCLHFDRVTGHLMTNSNSAFASESQSKEWKKTARSQETTSKLAVYLQSRKSPFIPGTQETTFQNLCCP
ncbi:MAG: hypothetical protein Ct9H90mP27_4030 [Gammaproteobacteria bacterium]|nr:MAG: hypothetical protein Ct9H90mP27_4030 [Gammaproteobacteria bacterium]